MWILVWIIVNIPGVFTFDLFPNQDKDFIGIVDVELLWEEASDLGGRDKRSVPTLPGQLAFQFSVSGEKVVLNLKQNSDLNADPSAFVVREGRAVPEVTLDDKDNLGLYQDVTLGAAIMVKKQIREIPNYELMGTYIVEEEQYTIQPIRVESGTGSRKSVANHSISRMMTHISLRNDILDFVEGPVIEEAASNNKRQKREATLNTVELLIVTDFAIYNTWYQMTKGSSQAEKRRKALENMKQYYAFVLNGIDLRYASIKEPDFRIDVTFAGIVIIDDPQESMWTVGLAGAETGDNFVESSDALESFRSWVLTNATSFPPHDHVMLFTGYNLTYGGSTANAGLAYIKSMCNPEFSISIVEEYFEFRIIAIAAHELGHSLGARHDMDGNKCFAFFLYIMTSRFRFPTRSKATNPWRFSKCSIDYFRKYIETLNSNGTNCLLTTESTTNEIAGFLGDQPGQVYTPDKQCQVNFQSDESHVCRDKHKGKYTSACSQGLLCRVPGGGGGCEKIVPADGTPCDVDKWCMGGRCIPTSEPLEWTGDCPLGDTPGLLAWGGACPDLVMATPRVCYNTTVRLECCESCASGYTGIADCDYGDRQADCQAELCPSYTFDTQNVTCCGTCHNFFNPTTPTTPGPLTTPTTPASTVTTSVSADVVETATSSYSPELTESTTRPYDVLSDTSTKSEKLMKSELMPTSETSVPATTSQVAGSTETGAPGLTQTTSVTIDTTGNQGSPSVVLITSTVASTQPTSSTTRSRGFSPVVTSVPDSRSPALSTTQGVLDRKDGPNTHMARLWSIKRLQQLRQLRLRQRQEAARRQWLFHYNRLRSRKPGHYLVPNMRTNGRMMQRGNRFGGENLSWEHSMEEVENEREADDRQWGRRKRSLGVRGEVEETFSRLKKRRKTSLGRLVEMEREDTRQSLSSVTNSLSTWNTVSSVTNALNSNSRMSSHTTTPTVTNTAPVSNTEVIFLNVVPDLSPDPEKSESASPAKVFHKRLENENSVIKGENAIVFNSEPNNDKIQYRNTASHLNAVEKDEKSSPSQTEQTSPDFLLHRPKSTSGDTHVSFKYKVINFDPRQADDSQVSWIFHAMIDPSMIPVQTKWINTHQQHKDRMMPFDGEIYRGRSKGAKVESGIKSELPSLSATGGGFPLGEPKSDGNNARPQDQGIKGENRNPGIKDVESRLVKDMDVPVSPEKHPGGTPAVLTVKQEETYNDGVKEEEIFSDLHSVSDANRDAKQKHNEISETSLADHAGNRLDDSLNINVKDQRLNSDEHDSRDESDEVAESNRALHDSARASPAHSDHIHKTDTDFLPKRTLAGRHKGDRTFDSVRFIHERTLAEKGGSVGDDGRDVQKTGDDQREITVSQRREHADVDTTKTV